MGKNIRRGRTGSVRCSSCGQITRRDRAVYLFKDGIKSYYCPDCAKKVHGKRLYKGMPKYVKKVGTVRVKRKFTIFATEDSNNSDVSSDSEVEESQINLSKEKEEQNNGEIFEQKDDIHNGTEKQEEPDDKEGQDENNDSESNGQ